MSDRMRFHEATDPAELLRQGRCVDVSKLARDLTDEGDRYKVGIWNPVVATLLTTAAWERCAGAALRLVLRHVALGVLPRWGQEGGFGGFPRLRNEFRGEALRVPNVPEGLVVWAFPTPPGGRFYCIQTEDEPLAAWLPEECL